MGTLFVCIVTDAGKAAFAPAGRATNGKRAGEGQMLLLRGLHRLGSQKIDDRRIFQQGRERRIFFYFVNLRVAFLFGLAKVEDGAFGIAGFRERLGQQEIEAATVRHGAILQNRTVAGRAALEELRIFGQCGTEGVDGIIVLALAEICIAQVAVQHRHIVAHLDRFLIGADSFAEFLALIPDGADVVLSVGVLRVSLHSLFVIFQRKAQSGLLVQRDAQLIQEHGVVRILLAQHSVLIRRLAILLAGHVQIALFFVGYLVLGRVRCRGGNLRLRLHRRNKRFLAGIIAGLANRGEGQANEEKTNGQRQSSTTHGESPLLPASLIPASLRRPVWACRSPSSYPQRYQKSSSRDSFSFPLPYPWLLWLRALAALVGLVLWHREDDSDRTGPV